MHCARCLPRPHPLCSGAGRRTILKISSGKKKYERQFTKRKMFQFISTILSPCVCPYGAQSDKAISSKRPRRCWTTALRRSVSVSASKQGIHQHHLFTPARVSSGVLILADRPGSSLSRSSCTRLRILLYAPQVLHACVPACTGSHAPPFLPVDFQNQVHQLENCLAVLSRQHQFSSSDVKFDIRCHRRRFSR